MTTLYRPVPITSAEQAERMPEGTIFHDVEVEYRYPLNYEGKPIHLAADLADGVRVTALVPVEAEEVRSERVAAGHVIEPYFGDEPMTAYITKETR